MQDSQSQDPGRDAANGYVILVLTLVHTAGLATRPVCSDM